MAGADELGIKRLVDGVEIGRGWFSRVYAATDTRYDRHLRSRCSEVDQTVPARIDALDYGSLLDEMHAQAPNAEIVIVGYPNLFSASRIPEELVICALIVSGLERDWMVDQIDHINSRMQAAADAVNYASYVDIQPVYEDHDACSDEKYINAFHPLHGHFHPNELGHYWSSSLIAQAFGSS